MLNKGRISLLITIDFLILFLKTVEWIDTLKGIQLLLAVNLIFKSRWYWQVILPSLLIYYSTNIKAYFQRIHSETLQKSKLDLILDMNSLTQHALFLKDRIFWLYESEINFLFDLFKGNLSFKAKISLISLIIVSFGFLKLASLSLELLFMHILLKHTQFGLFYRNLFNNFKEFVDFVFFYKNIRSQTFPPPFKLQKNEFITINILENQDANGTAFFTDELGSVYYSLESLAKLKPIVKFMKEEISDWQLETTNDPSHKTIKKRLWQWTTFKEIKIDYSHEEWEYFKQIYKVLNQL